MNAAGCLAHTRALQRRTQMTKLAQMSQLWHGHHTGSPVPATSRLLDFLLFWEEVSDSPPSSFRNLHGTSKVPGVRFLSLPLHTLPSELKARPLELFSGKKAAFCSWTPLLGYSTTQDESQITEGSYPPSQSHPPNSIVCSSPCWDQAWCTALYGEAWILWGEYQRGNIRNDET